MQYIVDTYIWLEINIKTRMFNIFHSITTYGSVFANRQPHDSLGTKQTV